MNALTFQQMINAFSVGNWLQTILFYSSLAFMYSIIIMQSKVSAANLGIDVVGEGEAA
jgi:hypothetical protein